MAYKYQYDSLVVWIKRGVAFVKISSPGNLNALTNDVRADLSNCLKKASQDDRIKVTVITGEGRVFSVGGSQGDGNAICELISDMEKPVIAAVNGYAIGAGMELAIGCDMVIAAEDAKFCEISSQRDIDPHERKLYFMSPSVDEEDARERRFAVRTIGAREAAEMGIVNVITPKAELFNEVLKQAASIAKGFTISIKYVKRLKSRTGREEKANVTSIQDHSMERQG